MVRSKLLSNWGCRLLLCAICIFPSLAFGQSQISPDKQANLTDQEKIKRILDDIKKKDREKPPAPDPKKLVADQAASRIAQTNNRLASLQQLQTQRERSFNGVLGSVDQSAVVSDKDITYPKDWKERTKGRTSSLTLMTAKEESIFRSLNSSMTVRLKNAPFNGVIDYLQTKTGLNFVIDPAALKEADVSSESPVSIDVKDVSVRTILHKVLGDVGLTYVIRNEAIMVVTPGMAKRMMVTRTYYIRDLLPNDWGFFSAVQAAQLIDMIQSTVEPQSWKANGGDGTIVYDPITRALIVKQNAEFHSVLASGAR
jgi:hypothetical protein